jgi:4-amino-4-deoxy-L-arabinose transferase-like glycosyltransferase
MARVNAGAKTRLWWATVTILLLLAFGLRVWNLEGVPPGLTHDEASNGHDSAAILRGVHRIYFPVGYGHEPLYNYSVALVTLFLGQSIHTLRITTVFWSLIQIILVTAIAHRWWGRAAALAVLAAYAASFWALMLARVGLRAPVLPALLAASVLAYDHAASAPPGRHAWRGYAAAGLALGASFYTYMASRGMPLLYAGFLILALLFDRQRFRRIWRGTLQTLLVAAAVGAPLFLHLRANPGLEQRVGQLSYAITALAGGDPAPLWRNITDSLPLLVWRGDPFWLYNIAGRPGLEPLLALLFIVGLLAALARPRDQHHTLVLLWLGVGLAPALIAPVAYNLLRAVGAMPAALLMVALGARSVVQLRLERTPKALATALLATAWLVTGATTAHAYFAAWATHPDVRVAYHHHVVALGRHLEQSPDTSPVVVTSLYPGEFHDPYTMEVTLRRENLSLHWADGRSGLAVPDRQARFYVEQQTQPPEDLWALLADDIVPVTTLSFAKDAHPAWTRGYTWNAPATWERIVVSLDTEVMGQRGDPPPWMPHARLQSPLVFGETVALVGYRVTAGEGVLRLLTAWTVVAPTDAELVIFAHLLDPEGNMVSQNDRLSVPSWQWEAGDRFIQVHTLPSSSETDAHTIAIGLYTYPELTRLLSRMPSPTGGCAFTRALLPLEVTP